jgi:hypothetical protein
VAQYAWYSAKAEKPYGSVVWRHVEGYPVIVTCIGDSPNKSPSYWGDEVCQGEVTEYMTRAVKGTEPERFDPIYFDYPDDEE